MTREKIYNVIELASSSSKKYRRASAIYDIFMIVIIIASLIPLGFKEEVGFFRFLDGFCVTIFIIDYILRLITADFKLKNHSITAFLRYPFTPMAIIDLLSILPSILLMYEGMKIIRIARLLRALRVLRLFRGFRYSKNIRIVVAVFREQQQALVSVLAIIAGYVIVTALLAFHAEPEKFENFYEALYWSVISVTTIGYGDIVLVTPIGRTITMLSALVGIAMIALPAGIITAGYVEEMEKHNRIRHHDALADLKRLLDEGLITKKDYAKVKGEILKIEVEDEREAIQKLDDLF